MAARACKAPMTDYLRVLGLNEASLCWQAAASGNLIWYQCIAQNYIMENQPWLGKYTAKCATSVCIHSHPYCTEVAAAGMASMASL